MLVKHPENLYQIANEKALLNDVVFYYQLKSLLPQDNKFKKQDYSNYFSRELNLSRPSIKKKILRLKQLHLLKEYTNCYCLASYNTLFTLLGYTFGKHNLKLFYKNYKVKLVKTDFKEVFGNLYDIKSYIAYSRIRENLSKQRNVVKKKFIELKLQSVEKSARKRTKNYYLKAWDSLSPKQINTLKKKFPSINFDITLSLHRIKELLGYKNVASAYKTIKDLKDLCLLDSKRRIRIFKRNFKSKFFPHNLFYSNNCLYIYTCNLITCIK